MKLYDVVVDLLVRYPKLRDSDKLLIWNVWGMMGFIKGGTISREDFLKAPTPETITRCRRKVQETMPELGASQSVRQERSKIEKQKSTHVYREEIAVAVKPKQWVFKDGKAYLE